MEALLSGLVCLVTFIQHFINIDLQISPDLIRIIWYSSSMEEVNDFQTFYFNTDQEKIKSVQEAINYVTECLITDILSKQTKEAA